MFYASISLLLWFQVIPVERYEGLVSTSLDGEFLFDLCAALKSVFIPYLLWFFIVRVLSQ